MARPMWAQWTVSRREGELGRGRFNHTGGSAVLPGGARLVRSRGPVMRTGRPDTAGLDEYQALQMLDEDVVKRGVSDRKMRSLPETPGAPRALAACTATPSCAAAQFALRPKVALHVPDHRITAPRGSLPLRVARTRPLATLCRVGQPLRQISTSSTGKALPLADPLPHMPCLRALGGSRELAASIRQGVDSYAMTACQHSEATVRGQGQM